MQHRPSAPLSKEAKFLMELEEKTKVQEKIREYEREMREKLKDNFKERERLKSTDSKRRVADVSVARSDEKKNSTGTSPHNTRLSSERKEERKEGSDREPAEGIRETAELKVNLGEQLAAETIQAVTESITPELKPETETERDNISVITPTNVACPMVDTSHDSTIKAPIETESQMGKKLQENKEERTVLDKKEERTTEALTPPVTRANSKNNSALSQSEPKISTEKDSVREKLARPSSPISFSLFRDKEEKSAHHREKTSPAHTFSFFNNSPPTPPRFSSFNQASGSTIAVQTKPLPQLNTPIPDGVANTFTTRQRSQSVASGVSALSRQVRSQSIAPAISPFPSRQNIPSLSPSFARRSSNGTLAPSSFAHVERSTPLSEFREKEASQDKIWHRWLNNSNVPADVANDNEKGTLYGK